jgi:hypothetical protein
VRRRFSRRGRRPLAGSVSRTAGIGARLAALFTLEELPLVFQAIVFTNRRAVHAQRTADEEPVAHIPGVVAAFAPERRSRRAPHLDLLALVEDVLLQLLPVRVTCLDHLPHERVEVGLRVRRGGAGRDERHGGAQQDETQPHERRTCGWMHMVAAG